MAGVVDSDVPKVVIKKEIEETPDSPNHADVQDSSPSQADTNGSQKLNKVWSDDETKSLLDLQKHYVEKFKDNNYSRKQFFEDVVQELNHLGYHTTPEKVRNKMKYFRARYKSMLEYNAKHADKKEVPYQRELSELYNNPLYFEDEPFVNGCDLSYKSSKITRNKKKTKPFTAPPGEFKSVTTRKKSSAVSKASKLKKKAKAKKTVQQPLFQCGRCMMKFPSSSEMHGHSCKASVKINHEIKKKSPPKSSQTLTLWLKPTGNAPILKNKKWTVEKKQTIAMIMVFLKKYMNLEQSASMFLYVNQSFAPSPDIEVGNIYDCFNINGKLVLHYSTSPAWG